MPISDNNPDRRNVVLLAISIIIFILADGHLIDNKVRLQVINVSFNNPEVLVYFVWFMLAWFTYRYWLMNQGSWKKGFYNEIEDHMCDKICYAHMLKKFNLSNDYTNACFSDRHWLRVEGYLQQIKFCHISKKDDKAQIQDHKNIETLADRFFISVCVVYLFFKQPTLSTYFLPYFLSLLAVILGINKWL